MLFSILKKKDTKGEELEEQQRRSIQRKKTSRTNLAPTFYPPHINHTRVAIHAIVEKGESTVAKIFSWSILSLIVISIACFILETMPECAGTPQEFWDAIETISTVTFTFEYLLRLWVCDVYEGMTLLTWVRQPMNLCDLFAILPFYITMGLESSNIKGLRVLRALRLFKLGRYSQGVEVMATAMIKSFSALSILLFLFMIGLVLFSSTVYFTEKLFCPDFDDISARGLQDFYQYSVECEGNAMSESFGICCAYQCRGFPQPLLDNLSLCVYDYKEKETITGRRLSSLEDASDSWGEVNATMLPQKLQIDFSSLQHSSIHSDEFSDLHKTGLDAAKKMLEEANASSETSEAHALEAQSLIDRVLTETVPGTSIDYDAIDWEVMSMHSTGFPSIVIGFWWTCVTMTTVGYGDLTPAHWLSKCVAALAMLTGILLIALPVSIVGVKLHEAIQIVEGIPEEETPKPDEKGDPKKTLSQADPPSLGTQRVSAFAAVAAKAATRETLPPASTTMRALRDALVDANEVKRQLMILADERDDVLTSLEHAIAQLCQECIVSQAHLTKEGGTHDPLAFLLDGPVAEETPKHCQKSLYVFDLQSPVRKVAIGITESPWFDRLILFLIVANSVLLANEDFYHPDALVNRIMEESEIYFTIAFTCEFVIKVIAMGFFVDDNCYLRDTWNLLDFTVVVSGLVTLVLGAATQGGGLSFLRTFRVLRPLRSLSAMPGVRALVDTVLLSLPRLVNVFALGVFLFVTFGILGINFWAGTMHRRCRLTPQPLHFTKTASASSCRGWCFDDSSSLMYINGASIKSSLVFDMFCGSDPDCLDTFKAGGDYYKWPLDDNQMRFCGGGYSCVELESAQDVYDDPTVAMSVLRPMGVSFSGNESDLTQNTFCGSALSGDAGYGPQAINAELENVNLNAWEQEVNVEDFNWGLTHFDTLACAFLVIFQCITLEGWVDIMYLLMDAHGNEFAAVYFSLLIVIGSFFLLNITLAIVWDAFSDIEAERAEQEAEEADEVATGTKGVGGIRIESQSTKQDGFHFSFGEMKAGPRRSVTSVLQDNDGTGVVVQMRKLANSETFNSFIMVIIVLNIVTLAMDSYPPPGKAMRDFLDVVNLIFTLMFGMEFVVFNVALGPWRYWTNYMYGFDGVIVISSILELIMNTISQSGDNSAISALRGFRLLRIFKLAKKWHSFRLLLKAIITTVLQMGNFVLLLVLMIVVFTLMGQSFFGGYFMFDDDGIVIDPSKKGQDICPFGTKSNGQEGRPECIPRAHFDSFIWGFITIFQMLSGENWNTVMYDGMKARGWPFLWYFVGVVVMGNFVILNLFLAILMTNFEETSNRIREVEAAKQEATRQRQGKAEKQKSHIVNVLIRGNVMGGGGGKEDPEEEENKNSGWNVLGNLEEAGDQNQDEEDGGEESGAVKRLQSAQSQQLDPETTSEDLQGIFTYSLFIFPPGSCIREGLFRLAKNSKFDNMILVCIIVSSLLMAFSNPLNDPNSALETGLRHTNTFFTILFTSEMLMKVVAMGLIIGPDTYLRNSWNILDCVVVIVSLIDLMGAVLGGDMGGAGQLRTLRMLRALRPLRLISRNENLKLVVNTLFKSIPELCNLLVVTVLFLLIFGLMGVNFFKGSLYTCVDAELEGFDFEYRGIDVGLPVCVSGSGAPLDPKFLYPHQPGPVSECDENPVVYKRTTRDTPICEVRCNSDADAHTFCQEVPIWGYHIMQCIDCQQHFCPDKTKEDIEDCRDGCLTHDYFCKGGDEACLQQCMHSCACGDYCHGLAEDAALCLEQGGRWVNMNQNFNNIMISVLSLFEISTTEGWVDLMYAGVDARGPMMNPERDTTELFAIFFVAFILIGSFFMLNLCVGVIIDNFNKMKSDKKGSILMTDSQAAWVQAQRHVWTKKQFFVLTNLHELSVTRRRFFFFVVSPPFENTIMGCICLNTVVMAMQVTPTPSRDYAASLKIINMCFTMVFNLEAVLKLAAMRLNYFSESWNLFDFCCVISTDVGMAIELAGYGMGFGTVMSAIRLFRIARLFRLIRFMKGLNQLFTAFLLSIPKLGNVSAILVLLLFLFAVLGVNLFSKVLFHGPHNEMANFRTFPTAVMTLIRSMTGEAWNELMHSLSKDKLYFEMYMEMHCEESTDYETMVAQGVLDNPNECGNPLSFFFFLTYTLLVTFVILNLFIAVIFEGFDESQKSEESEIIQKCVEVWKKYDPNFTMLISIDATFEFIDEVIKGLNRDGAGDATNTRVLGGSGQSWEKYDLYYMRVIQLRVTPQNEVRFVRAILAVLRRIACMGGLDEKLSKCDRIERLKELEWLERDSAQENQDMVNIRALENKRMKTFVRREEHQQKVKVVGKRKSELHQAEEIPLEQVVAAAKIQILFQAILLRKRGKRKLVMEAAKAELHEKKHEPLAEIQRSAG